MISSHEQDIIEEITSFNTMTIASAAYTLYEKLTSKKPISKRDFLRDFNDNMAEFHRLFFETQD